MDAAHSLRRLARRAGIRRSTAATARLFAERAALSAVARHRAGTRPRILCYHSIGTPAWGVNDVSPARFRRQIESALAVGYTFRSAADLAANRVAPDAAVLAVTFDDGLRSVAEHAAPILRDYGIPWTLFVVTDWASGHHGFGEGTMLGWQDLERLAADGATIASHSVTHANFARLQSVQVADELVRSRSDFRSRLGIEPDEFAIPFGQSVNWNAACRVAAAEAGYAIVYAQSEDRRTPGTVARTFVTRFDGDRIFRAALGGAFDRWEEWH